MKIKSEYFVGSSYLMKYVKGALLSSLMVMSFFAIGCSETTESVTDLASSESEQITTDELQEESTTDNILVIELTEDERLAIIELNNANLTFQ